MLSGENGVRPKDTLAYLRATLRKSVPYYRMKLMVVGLQVSSEGLELARDRDQSVGPFSSIAEMALQIPVQPRRTEICDLSFVCLFSLFTPSILTLISFFRLDIQFSTLTSCNRALTCKQRRRQRQRKRHPKIYIFFIRATLRLFQLAQFLQKWRTIQEPKC